MRKINFLLLFMFFGALVSCDQNNLDDTELLESGAISNEQFIASKFMDNYSGKIGECGLSTYEFKAGSNSMDAGDVEVSYDDMYLYVKVTSNAGFQDVEENVKMWIGKDLNDLPTAGNGAPINGQFPYKANVSGDTHVFQIALADIDGGLECDDPFFIIVHGDVMVEYNGQTSAQTAYAGDKEGEGNRWWWYMEESVECCDEDYQSAYMYKGEDHVTCFEADGDYGWSNEHHYRYYRSGLTRVNNIYVNENNTCEVPTLKIGTVEFSLLNPNTDSEVFNFHFSMSSGSEDYSYEIYMGWENPVDNGMIKAGLTFETIQPGVAEFNYTRNVSLWDGTDPRIADPTLSDNPLFYVIVKVIIPE